MIGLPYCYGEVKNIFQTIRHVIAVGMLGMKDLRKDKFCNLIFQGRLLGIK